MMDVTKVIDNYSVEVLDGCKVIHYNGFTWPNDNETEFDGIVPEYLADEMTFCYVPVNEYSKDRLNDEMEKAQQCQYPLSTKQDVMKYLNGCKHLPLFDVNEDTTCGHYWCYLEEE